MDIEGAVSVVTGAASGIGRATAIRLAAEGSDLVLADVDIDGLHDTAKAVEPSGCQVEVVKCDVATDDDFPGLLAASESLDGTVRIVVANAGIAVGGLFQSIPMAEWNRIVQVNVLGVVRTINTFLPDLIRQGSGTVVITSSVQGLLSENADMAPYITTKSALVGLARSLAAYTRPLGINVTLLCPSLTATPFPNAVRLWSSDGPTTRKIDLPDDVDTPEGVASLMAEAIRKDVFLASPSQDLSRRVIRWILTPESSLPALAH